METVLDYWYLQECSSNIWLSQNKSRIYVSGFEIICSIIHYLFNSRCPSCFICVSQIFLCCCILVELIYLCSPSDSLAFLYKWRWPFGLSLSLQLNERRHLTVIVVQAYIVSRLFFRIYDYPFEVFSTKLNTYIFSVVICTLGGLFIYLLSI